MFIHNSAEDEKFIALIRLVIRHPERLLIKCNKCNNPKEINEIVIRDGIVKGACKKCESLRVKKYQNKKGESSGKARDNKKAV